MARRCIAVYGGSFDPPHVGHLMVTAWLRWTARSDAVWWVPVRGHPFAKDLLGFDLRIALCQAAVHGLDQVEVCDVERDLPVPSYTIDTLDQLSARHPDARFRLVVGADVIGQTASWRRWDEIAARYAPIVVGRAGYPPVAGAVTFPEISSTEIRDRVRRGRPVDAFVPAAILERVLALYSSG